MLTVAHLCPDEKFIDIAINIFSDIEVESTFYIATDTDSINFVKNKNVIKCDKTIKTIELINLKNYDYIIIHSLYFFPQKLLNNLNSKIILITWGYDIESDKTDYIKMPITLNLFKEHTRKAIADRPLKDKLNRIYNLCHSKIFNWSKYYYKVFNKISYASTVLPNEFDLLKVKNNKLNYFPFDYMDKKANIEFVENIVTNNNVLIGHSLLPTNNHIDILNYLESKKIKCNAYIPLAYPNGNFEQFNSESYKNKIIEYSKNLNFVKCNFLTDFIDKYEYFKIIDSCSVAIFGQLRQEAVGNINHMLYTGKKIFMYKEGINYQYYSKYTKIFDIESELNAGIFDSPLELVYQLQNYIFIHEKENYIDYINNLNKFFKIL